MSLDLPYGRVFVPSMLEDDVLRLLAPDTVIDGGLNWLATLVYNVKQQAGLPADADLPTPKSWNTVSAVDDWPVGRLPAVLVVSGPSDADPERDMDGVYLEAFRLEVSIVDSASTIFEARRNAGIYAMAARAALTQHLGDANTSGVLGILAGQYDPRPLPVRDPARKDTVAAGMVACHVVIGDVLTDTVSIIEPPAEPDDSIPSDPTAETVGIDVTQS